jgi:hypothetical protein
MVAGVRQFAIYAGMAVSFIVCQFFKAGILQHSGQVRVKAIIYTDRVAFAPEGNKYIVYDLLGIVKGIQEHIGADQHLFPVTVVKGRKCCLVVVSKQQKQLLITVCNVRVQKYSSFL